MLFLVIEKLLLIYFGTYLFIDLLLFSYALKVFLKKKYSALPEEAYKEQTISIIVPGYNESVTIVPCLKQLLKIDYKWFKLIFVNDGSSDDTMQKVRSAFNLTEVDLKPSSIATAQIKGSYRTDDGKLTVIDKENGGKADSVNAGINISDTIFICTVDADSILDPNALQSVLEPMLSSPSTFVSGGQLAAANDVTLVNSNVVTSKMPTNLWVLWQIVEYIKSFMISKIGLSRINSLLVMSGAFSVYRKNDLEAVGGFLSKLNRSDYLASTIGVGKHTVCEDMEIVVRLWRYYRDNGIKGNAVFVPTPVCWTEVPENGRNLFRQRTRWHLGLAETLYIHRDMIFEPKYGVTALFALPYSFIFEFLSPVIKLFAIIFIIAASLTGFIDGKVVFLFTTGVLLLTAIFTSTITVFIEAWSQHHGTHLRDALRYRNFKDWFFMLIVAIAGDFSYSFFKMAAQLNGTLNFLRKKSEWNKFQRKGFNTCN